MEAEARCNTTQSFNYEELSRFILKLGKMSDSKVEALVETGELLRNHGKLLTSSSCQLMSSRMDELLSSPSTAADTNNEGLPPKLVQAHKIYKSILGIASHSFQLQTLQLANAVILGSLKSLCATSHEERMELQVSYRSICFPTAVLVLEKTGGELESALQVFKDRQLLIAGVIIQGESDFIKHFSAAGKKNLPAAAVNEDTLLVDILATKCTDFVHPGGQQREHALEQLFRKYDVYDTYVRRREDFVAKLRRRVKGANETLEKVYTLFIDYFESFKLQVLTIKCASTRDVMEHPLSHIIEAELEKWVLRTFDPDTAKRLMSFKLYNAPNTLYPLSVDLQAHIEAGKNFQLAFLVDDNMTKASDIFDKTLDEFKEARFMNRKGAGDKIIDNESMVEQYVLCCMKVEMMMPAGNNYFQYSKEWIESCNNMNVVDPATVEEYLTMRNGEVGGYIHASFSYCLQSNYFWDAEVRRVATACLTIENDIYSYGMEFETEKGQRGINIIEVWKRCYPELTYQEVMYEVEKLRDKLFDQMIEFKGTKHHCYYISNQGAIKFFRESTRYSRWNLLSQTTALIFLK